MYVPIDQMTDKSRVWIFQAERKLSEAESAVVEDEVKRFVDSWKAHGADLIASYSLEKNQFLVISVNEESQAATGCSIDASVHVIAALEQKLGLSLRNNDKVAFMVGEEIQLHPFLALKKLVSEGSLSKETTVFDNTVQEMGQFREKWENQAINTWLSRYYN